MPDGPPSSEEQRATTPNGVVARLARLDQRADELTTKRPWLPWLLYAVIIGGAALATNIGIWIQTGNDAELLTLLGRAALALMGVSIAYALRRRTVAFLLALVVSFAAAAWAFEFDARDAVTPAVAVAIAATIQVRRNR